MTELDDRTPIIVGVGQVADPIDAPDYHRWSPVDIAAESARLALADAGVDGSSIDTIAAIRQFEVSTPISFPPFGCSSNVPRSIARRIGADPARAIVEIVGGQSPQALVAELGEEMLVGRSEVALIAGGEAMSSVRHLAGDGQPDWSENPGGQLEDRGFGLRGVTTLTQVRHGLMDAPSQYALLEHARRGRLGLDRTACAASMGELFAPFTQVAAAIPLSAAPVARTADDLSTVTDENRMVADPYPRALVARDLVNQGAAVLLMTVAAARRLDVPEHRWVYLHGHADLVEKTLLERPDLGASPAASAAIGQALERAGVGIEQIDAMDLYSCFPIAVSAVCDALGLAPDDPRGLTLTGGLPYFGGPGNNYSTHAIAEAVERARSGQTVLVGANGGIMSKYSAGVYSAAPAAWPHTSSRRAQEALETVESVAIASRPDGWATIESYTVASGRRGDAVVIVGRLEAEGSRFLANPFDDDEEILALLTGDAEPLGARVWVRSFGYGNRVTLTRDRAEQLAPTPTLGLRDTYEHIAVRRDGRVLEVTINRPEVRNALHIDAHLEMNQVFDTFEADPDLWVAIVTGAGDKAFCAGNDLTATASGGFPWEPDGGFGGLTSRRLTKPVIAAVNGIVYGGGFEIALAAHLVVADEEAARFALPEVKVGLFAAAGGVVRLPRRIPPAIANDLVLTGRSMDAAEASRLGLVSRLAPAGGTMAAARALAAEIIAVSPTSVRLSLQTIEDTRGIADEIDAVRHDTDALDQLLVSQDTMEGILAFAEKRPPQWRNL
ncbi:acetyl-CoA acetyltransferase [Aeromicrobium sp. CF3.5]|uniref:acetyl-CoA acetyltransferase n=1 Tax=Aeromicrobium sp. CF3.5 TaxID=3373078 RepID=UPI003EE50CCF